MKVYAGDMNHLTAGIFHDESFSKELGKKGTESDIVMYNRKTDQHIFTFMHPLDDKITAKSQIISSIDTAIVFCTELTPEVGETILMLDAVGISQGMIVVPPYAEMNRFTAMTKGTSLGSFILTEKNIPKILENLERIISQRDRMSPPVVVVDHSFSVKGVGEVVLGFVKQGTIRKHDTLTLLPSEEEVVVRSIQMQDRDYEEAEAGSRVGLVIKGATVDEMRRGSLLCAPGCMKTSTKLMLSFIKNRFYPEVKEGLFYLTVGMQTLPMKIVKVENEFLTIELEKPVAYTSADTFLLLDLNAKKLHLMGKGKAVDTTE